ncbi:asparaginase [Jiangella asiatica]|uniref:Asparaginase n=1 Tax=Jiangella asiatica TaxID=2530372 RepID=A0A4R5CGI1_9ACTN|nr:asparaginase [Jiangella asiatica]TDD96374.1 asparaginase [Jiangella asiatica]
MHAGKPVLVAEVVRSGMVESRHHGTVVGLASDGSPAFQGGRVGAPLYPRSSNKPAQAAAMVRLGLPLEGELLALAAASHSGEDIHQDGVRRILAQARLDTSALRNTPGWPIDSNVMVEHVRAGHAPSSLAADCSGKHAAMLLTCVVNGWSTDGYLHPEHQLQRSIHDTVAELAGEPVAHTGVDGCGAPLFALTPGGLARMFRSLATAPAGSAERTVVEAIQRHPEYTSGTARDEAELINGVPGLFCKGGADAVMAAALDDGRAVALKIDDGGARARTVVLVAALQKLGVDAPVLDKLATEPVLGGGVPVGEVRAVLP